MNTRFKLTLIAACLAVPLGALAADATPMQPRNTAAAANTAPNTADAPTAPRGYSDRDRMQAFAGEKDKLEKELGTGHDRAYYRQQLEKMGYHITAVNSDKPDYLEYEVVHGTNSYEIQVDFDNNSKMSTKLDVAANVWQAPSTEKALDAGKDYKYTYPAATTPNAANYSDRARMKTFNDQKDRLEKTLGTGHDEAYYKQTLEKQGYKVTLVNKKTPDYVEYEVVKGKDTYEVQVNFDDRTRRSTKVDVAANMWKTDATERALGEK